MSEMGLEVTRAELIERADSLRGRMAAAGLNALLLTTGDNLRYVSGYPSPARSGPRPFLFILPMEGEPVFIVHSGREREARRFSWAEDIRTYYRLSHAPLDLVDEAMSELGLRKGRIGVEIGTEQCFDIPQSDFFELQGRLPETSFVDSAPVLWPARMHKTPLEIARVRRACAITGQAFEACFQAARAGMNERQVAHLFRSALLELGAEDTWLLLTSGPGNYDQVSRGPSARLIERGDTIYLDGGCCIEGYWCDFDRTGVVGGPDQQQLKAHQVAEEATRRGVEMVKPGANTREIAQACSVALEEFPYPITSDIGALAARIGHGIGLSPVEPPNVADYENTVLEPGMIISIEPGVATTFGVYHIEQDVLVTEYGHELLSTCPTHIRTISI